MFGRLYLGELRKQTSKSAIITLVIIMAVLLLLTAVLFDALNDMIEEALQGDEATFESVYTEESAKQLLEYYRGELDKAVAAKEEAGFDYYRNYDSVYMYESYVAFMEYVIDNELYGVEIASVSNGVLNAGAGVTAETFTTTVGSMLILLVVIYAAIVAGGTFADEYKRGTVKMLLIRPVSRNAVTTAKLLSALTHTVAAYTVMFACTEFGIQLIRVVQRTGNDVCDQSGYRVDLRRSGVCGGHADEEQNIRHHRAYHFAGSGGNDNFHVRSRALLYYGRRRLVQIRRDRHSPLRRIEFLYFARGMGGMGRRFGRRHVLFRFETRRGIGRKTEYI